MNHKAILLLIYSTLFLTLACENVENFDEVEQPRFEGHYAIGKKISAPANLKVVTFNIEFALEIESAIEELGTDENLKGADVIFLQEMDEVGTDAIAKELDYNYVYYPSNKNKNDQLFGLAILSKWPLTNDEKIQLPHTTPINNRKRIAITAETVVGEKVIRLYNIHPGTLSLPKAHRREQFESLVKHLRIIELSQDVDHAIIAGDFNTDKSVDIEYLVNLYGEEGFIWASEEVGPTWQKFSGLAKFTLDHIFSRGLILSAAGKPESTQASDHLPVWVDLEF